MEAGGPPGIIGSTDKCCLEITVCTQRNVMLTFQTHASKRAWRLVMGTRFSLAILLTLSTAAGLCAQSNSATLSGTVTDASGAVVANAAVQATNEETNVTQATRSNSVGLYSFPNLAPGRYRISVKNTGFKESFRTSLVL